MRFSQLLLLFLVLFSCIAPTIPAIEINPSVESQPFLCRYSLTKWICAFGGSGGGTGTRGINGTPGLGNYSVEMFYNFTGNLTTNSTIAYFYNYTFLNEGQNMTAGLQGPPGADGADGADGIDGLNNMTANMTAGPQGIQGIQGINGTPGPQGIQGEKGDKGDKGDTGAQGATGATGATGSANMTAGPQGPQGERGEDGQQGERGEDGQQGEPGAANMTAGPTGATGVTGPAGLDANVSSMWPVSSIYATTSTQSPATLLGAGTWASIQNISATYVYGSVSPTMTSDTLPSGNYTRASSSYSATYYPFKASDGTSNFWATAVSGAPWWWSLQIPSAKVVRNYTIYPRTDILANNPNTWKLNASNDGSTWVTLDTQTGITWPTTAQKSFPFTNTNAYTYYNISVSANNGGDGCAMQEVIFYEATGSTRPYYYWERTA